MLVMHVVFVVVQNSGLRHKPALML